MPLHVFPFVFFFERGGGVGFFTIAEHVGGLAASHWRGLGVLGCWFSKKIPRNLFYLLV